MKILKKLAILFVFGTLLSIPTTEACIASETWDCWNETDQDCCENGSEYCFKQPEDGESD